MTFAHSLLAADLLHGITWEVIVAGVGFAGLAFAVGRLSFRAAPATVSTETDPDPGPETKVAPGYDPFIHGSTHEQRRAVRRKGGHIDVLISDEHAKATPLHAWVIDRSTGGLRLSMARPQPCGTVLTVRTAGATKVVPWLELQVRSCREGKEGWELGCQFVRNPPLGLTLMFG